MRPGQQGHKDDDMKRQQGGASGQQQAESGSGRQQGTGQHPGDKTSEATRKGGKS
jgi:hypothetical protein